MRGFVETTSLGRVLFFGLIQDEPQQDFEQKIISSGEVKIMYGLCKLC